MAKAAKPKLTPEQKKVEDERRKREQEEEKLLKKRQKEKLEKKKAKEKRIEKRKKLEMKRRKSLINLPFKLLFQISTLITLLAFIVMFFGYETSLKNSIYYGFLIFTALYLGAGTVMIAIFFLVSQDKLVELEEQRKIEEERMSIKRKQEEKELEEMVEIEKQIASKKIAGMQYRTEHNNPVQTDSEEGFMLNPSSGLNDLDFMNSNFASSSNDMEKDFLNSEMNKAKQQSSYFESDDFDLPDINSFDNLETISADDEKLDDNFIPSENDLKSM